LSDLSDAIAFLNGYLARLITDNLDTRTLLNQMSFGLINIAPPPGEPSLTSQLNNIVFQIQSLREHLDIANTEMISQNVDILAAIAALPDGSGPVVLPTTPPTGYGVDDGSIAGAVWAYNVGGYTQAAGDLMLDAGMLAINLSSVEAHFPSGKTKYFTIHGTWFSTNGADTDRDYPYFPLANILPDDNLVVFLERESGFNGWTANGDGTWQVAQDEFGNDFRISSKITDAEFLVLRDGPAAAGALVAAPVWPGLANVTLSTPVALALGVTITEPMDGVIVSITVAPAKQGYFTFDDLLSYRNAGALTFIDDNGEAEQQQPLGFTSQVYCPKSMKTAAAVKLRSTTDFVGTVTPWITTPP
jgi:hypothetical protein